MPQEEWETSEDTRVLQGPRLKLVVQWSLEPCTLLNPSPQRPQGTRSGSL